MSAAKYAQLKGRLISHGYTYAEAAREIGISLTSFSNKMNKKTDFTQPEIRRLCDFLEIPPSEIGTYFFAS